MPSSDAGSVPSGESTSRSRRLAVVAALVLLGSSALVRSTSVVDPTVAVGALALLATLAVVALWRRSAAPTDAERADESEPSDVWNAIPDEQYEGRHAESGGIARGEQERALQNVQRRADELADDPSR